MGMNAEKQKFAQILDADDERARIIGQYAKYRSWKKLYNRYTKSLGLSYEETKRLGYFVRKKLGKAVYSEPKQTQKLEREQQGEDLHLTAKGARIKTLDQLLDAAEVNPEDWRVESYKVNTWEVASRGPDGMEVTPVWQVKASLSRNRLADVRPVIPSEIIQKQAMKPRRDKILRALFIPDSQHGFRWNAPDFDRLEPFHDRVAFDSVCEFASAFQPDTIVLLGDMLDLAPFSSYPTDPATRQTTQPALAELHWQLKQLRKKCPRSKIVFLGGNHELRLQKSTKSNLEEASYLRNADEKRGQDTVFSVQRLLALDALDIDYVADYDDDWWLWNRIRVFHGRTVRAGGGSTVAARIKSATHSEVFGHIHRVELAQKTLHGPKGQKVITSMTPGCLCLTDGSIPGASKIQDWQQGVGIAYVDLEHDTEHLSLVPIHGGTLVHDGRVYMGQDRAQEIAEETGFLQIKERP